MASVPPAAAAGAVAAAVVVTETVVPSGCVIVVEVDMLALEQNASKTRRGERVLEETAREI